MTYIEEENPRCYCHQGKQKNPCKKCFAYINNSKTEYECQPTPLYAFNGRMVAALWGNVLVKKVKGSKHMLRRPLGWACDAMVVDVAKSMGAEWIHIWDTESDTIYESSLENFISYGSDINRGFGDQIVLAIHKWNIVCPEETMVK